MLVAIKRTAVQTWTQSRSSETKDTHVRERLAGNDAGRRVDVPSKAGHVLGQPIVMLLDKRVRGVVLMEPVHEQHVRRCLHWIAKARTVGSDIRQKTGQIIVHLCITHVAHKFGMTCKGIERKEIRLRRNLGVSKPAMFFLPRNERSVSYKPQHREQARNATLGDMCGQVANGARGRKLRTRVGQSVWIEFQLLSWLARVAANTRFSTLLAGPPKTTLPAGDRSVCTK